MSNTKNRSLQDFRSNITSQFGEDGILAELLNRLGVGAHCCVEFGAWDGQHFSNTWSLWHEKGWSAVLIEADPGRCTALRAATAKFPCVKVINAFVGWEGPSRLDSLLDDVGLDGSIDVMSIDIDGDDYHVLDALQKHLPRILLAEFNPTCPPGSDFVQAKGGRFGSSATSMLKLAESKGYALAACTDTNLILVLDAEFRRLEMDPVKLADVLPMQHLTYLMTDYDGRAYLNTLPVYAPKLNAFDVRARLSPVKKGWSKFFHGQVQQAQVFRIDH